MWITVGSPIRIVRTDVNTMLLSTVSGARPPISSTRNQHRTDPSEQDLLAFIPNVHRPYY